MPMTDQERIELLEKQVVQLKAELDAQLDEKIHRKQNAENIVAQAERDRGYTLADEWRYAARSFVANGLTIPNLHLLFDTLMRIDRREGKIPPAEDPIEALIRETQHERKKRKR